MWSIDPQIQRREGQRQRSQTLLRKDASCALFSTLVMMEAVKCAHRIFRGLKTMSLQATKQMVAQCSTSFSRIVEYVVIAAIYRAVLEAKATVNAAVILPVLENQ